MRWLTPSHLQHAQRVGTFQLDVVDQTSFMSSAFVALTTEWTWGHASDRFKRRATIFNSFDQHGGDSGAAYEILNLLGSCPHVYEASPLLAQFVTDPVGLMKRRQERQAFRLCAFVLSLATSGVLVAAYVLFTLASIWVDGVNLVSGSGFEKWVMLASIALAFVFGIYWQISRRFNETVFAPVGAVIGRDNLLKWLMVSPELYDVFKSFKGEAPLTAAHAAYLYWAYSISQLKMRSL